MKLRILSSILSLCGAALGANAWGSDAQLSIDLPAPQGARVKRPYLAVWLEKAGDHAFAGNVAVWYDTGKPNNRGTKWLSDLRAWWRASGSAVSLPIDGVSGATRPAGDYTLDLGAAGALRNLPAGDYDVVVEAVREHGGYDLVRLPLQWPPRVAKTSEASGAQELGRLRLSTQP